MTKRLSVHGWKPISNIKSCAADYYENVNGDNVMN